MEHLTKSKTELPMQPSSVLKPRTKRKRKQSTSSNNDAAKTIIYQQIEQINVIHPREYISMDQVIPGETQEENIEPGNEDIDLLTSWQEPDQVFTPISLSKSPISMLTTPPPINVNMIQEIDNQK